MSDKLTARPLAPGDHAAWRSLWDASARRLVQRPGFVQAACGEGALRVVGVLSGERLELAVPFFVRRGRRVTAWMSPPFSPFCGPLVRADAFESPREGERFWRERLGALGDGVPRDAALLDLVAPPGTEDLRGLAWSGWDLRPHYNYVTEWTEDGSFAEGIESSVRRQARKAEREGLVFDSVPADDCDALLALWRATAGRQGLDAWQEANLAALARWIGEENAGWIAVVRERDGETVHAAALVGHDSERTYYLAGASDPERLGSGAPSLLQTGILEEIERRGLPRRYDWVGANTPSIARFKRHFGPRLEVLVAARRTSPRFRLMEALRATVRRG